MLHGAPSRLFPHAHVFCPMSQNRLIFSRFQSSSRSPVFRLDFLLDIVVKLWPEFIKEEFAS